MVSLPVGGRCASPANRTALASGRAPGRDGLQDPRLEFVTVPHLGFSPASPVGEQGDAGRRDFLRLRRESPKADAGSVVVSDFGLQVFGGDRVRPFGWADLPGDRGSAAHPDDLRSIVFRDHRSPRHAGPGDSSRRTRPSSLATTWLHASVQALPEHIGRSADLVGARKLAIDHPFEFETWAVSQLPGFAPNTQQQGDGGIDGRATLATKPDDAPTRLALAQVKGGRFHASHLRDFRHVIERGDAAVGCFVTLDQHLHATGPMQSWPVEYTFRGNRTIGSTCGPSRSTSRTCVGRSCRS